MVDPVSRLSHRVPESLFLIVSLLLCWLVCFFKISYLPCSIVATIKLMVLELKTDNVRKCKFSKLLKKKIDH